MGLFSALFSFEGRLGLVGYWRRGVLLSLLLAIVWAGMMFATMASPAGPLVALLMAPILVASISATTRRLHDRGRSLWWLLAVAGVSGICFALATLLVELGGANASITLPLMALGFALVIWVHVEVGFRRGVAGPNRFGQPPLRAAHRRAARTA